MIPLDSKTQLAQSSSKQYIRDFLEIRVKDLEGNPVSDYLWSGAENVTASVVDPLNGDTRTKTWIGAGNLVGLGPIIRSEGLTISTLSIELSGVSDRIRDLENAHIVKYGTVIIYRGYIEPNTGKEVAAARPRFLGKIASIEHAIGGEGSQSIVEVTCNNSINDLTRSNSTTRSNALQTKRSGGDTFHKFTVAIAKRELFWGRSN